MSIKWAFVCRETSLSAAELGWWHDRNRLLTQLRKNVYRNVWVKLSGSAFVTTTFVSEDIKWNHFYNVRSFFKNKNSQWHANLRMNLNVTPRYYILSLKVQYKWKNWIYVCMQKSIKPRRTMCLQYLVLSDLNNQKYKNQTIDILKDNHKIQMKIQVLSTKFPQGVKLLEMDRLIKNSTTLTSLF